ncbi:hypothetical protein R5H30_01090 [Sulfitobacter sp. D35]|uniref:hypothetical protein n=1 Tax=Sulfitobacter sp. D35 TaxID=3083252 RepID=UPI00296F574C|nr:hypothetical protein [Sulfitobacter sp. D35]MDW4496559.1 hypothetical protein [Sulfitobacter sp. D35]
MDLSTVIGKNWQRFDSRIQNPLIATQTTRFREKFPVVVFTPKSFTAVRAALDDQAQRAVNICPGVFVSTVGLKVPAVLVVGLINLQTRRLRPRADLRLDVERRVAASPDWSFAARAKLEKAKFWHLKCTDRFATVVSPQKISITTTVMLVDNFLGLQSCDRIA